VFRSFRGPDDEFNSSLDIIASSFQSCPRTIFSEAHGYQACHFLRICTRCSQDSFKLCIFC
jgi:hypothetical protein